MDITNAVVFACAMIRYPKLALKVVRQFHPDRDPRSVKLLIGRDDAQPIELTETSSAAEIEKAFVEAEKTLMPSASNRGARLDLYFEDDVVVIAFEMQRESEPFIVSRSLFVSAVLMSYLLKRGADFDDMKQVRVTFICLHDPFDYGECHNPMEFRLLKHLEVDIEMSPRIDFYYAGGDGRDIGENIQELMVYFKNPNAYDIGKANNDLIPELQAAAEEVIKDGRVQKMVAMAQLYDQSVYRKGRQEGIEIGKKEMALEMLTEDLLSVETIAKIAKVNVGQVLAWQKEAHK